MTCTQPSIVKSQPGIGVSYHSGSDIDGVILHVYRYYDTLRNSLGGFGRFKNADCHGKRFNSNDEATAFCLKRGYLMPFHRKAWK
jgi:hypothetical protein